MHSSCAGGESGADQEQKKTFLREVYRRVQAGIGCKFLQDTCLSCTAGIGHRLSIKAICIKCIRRVQAGSWVQIESKKTFLHEVYCRVQAGVGCRLSVKKFST